MLMTRSLMALVMVVTLASVSYAQSATFALTGENTKVEFVGSKKDGSHTGGFKKLAGEATAKNIADPATLSIAATIDVTSLYSDDPKLTGHLLAPDFFDAKKFPEAKFASTSIKKGVAGYTVEGELTLHGQTKKISFPATIAATAEGLKLTSKFTIDRTQFGMTYGKGMINDEVALTLSITAKK